MRVALALLLLVAMAEPVLAHPPPLGYGGFWGGVLHPMYVTNHMIGIFALGLLIGGQEPWGWIPAAAFVTALAAGLVAMTTGIVPRYADVAMLGTTIAAGLLVALARPLPRLIGVLLAAVLGVSIALDSPPEVLSVSEANWMLLGTAIGATLMLMILTVPLPQFPRWARIGVRIAGSWLAASAILALALRLVLQV
jgi:urease accessory protein